LCGYAFHTGNTGKSKESQLEDNAMEKQVYSYTKTDHKIIEKIVADEHVQINHVVLSQGESLPVHNANAFVYQIISRGIMKIAIEDREPELHEAGTILAISRGTKMAIENGGTESLEFFILKAPPPDA